MLVFIDESGYPRPTDPTKYPVLFGTCINETDIKPITNRIYKLKENYYGKQDEIKATKLIREATISKNRSNNKAYTEGIVDIVLEYNVSVFAVIMNRPNEDVIVPEHHLPRQYYLLLRKIEFFCKCHKYGKALLIFDEIHEDADRKIADALTGFLFKTELGRSFEHVLEMPLFVSSSVTPSIQLSDIYAGITRHYYEEGLDVHEPITEFQVWINGLFSKIYSRTENNRITSIDGTKYIEYGFQYTGFHDYSSREKTVLTKSD